jgi:hypothetical protein
MKVTMLLADSAQAVGGKLYILGGGWSITRADPPSPSALAIKIEVPWDQANVRHTCRIELVDSDFVPVMVPSQTGELEPLALDPAFEVGRPPGVKPGTPLDFTFAINFGPLPLDPGTRYEWRLSINGQADDDWRVAFSTATDS